jgi:hypothetical protein
VDALRPPCPRYKVSFMSFCLYCDCRSISRADTPRTRVVQRSVRKRVDRADQGMTCSPYELAASTQSSTVAVRAAGECPGTRKQACCARHRTPASSR